MVQHDHEYLKDARTGHLGPQSTALGPAFALPNDANPTLVQNMMRHQQYASSEIYVEEERRLLEGEEDAVTQIQAGAITLKKLSMTMFPSCYPRPL